MAVTISLEGKRALITGGATGIGYGIAKRLLQAGASVTIVGRREGHLARAVETLTQHAAGGSVAGRRCDITVEADVRAAVMTAAGGGGLDIVVANAGGARPGPLLAQSPEDWQDVLTLNLIGTSLTVKHAGLAMRETGGAIVAISSQSAVRPAKYNAMYTVSKAAVDSLVRCAAIELAPFSIRVNGIRPGLVLSEHSSRVAKEPYASLISKTLLGRHGSPEEIGDAVLYLTSEMGGWVTGQVLSVCGGLSVSDCDDMESLLGPQASEKSLTSRVHH